MNTESKSPRYHQIDLWNTEDILLSMLESQLGAVTAVEKIVLDIEAAIIKAVPKLKDNGRLVFAGAGTSGRIAAQESSELYPTFSWPKEKSIVLLAGGYKSLSESVENAEDDIVAGETEACNLHLNSNDVVICLAASGRTPYTLGVLREANTKGSLTIGIASVKNSPLLNEAKFKFFLDTGAEVITGSTRLKAGTAQKIVLNMFTSTVMIRLNRVYDSYMVDVVATNSKLIQRSINIISDICNVSHEVAQTALTKCAGKVKLACVYLKTNDITMAEKLLENSDGNLRKALED